MEAEARGHVAWAVTAAIVGVVVVLVVAALLVFYSLRALPGEVVEGGLEVAGKVQRIAGAFRQGSVETTFINYASRLSGSSFLQVASLRQTEVYTRTDEESVLWGQIALPDVVVSATAPVEYTYYLNLDEEWLFELEESVLVVTAPAIRFNSPSLDVSELHFDIRESSLLRDEESVVEALRAGLTELSRSRARDHIELVRETARRETRDFVRTWLVGTFTDAGHYQVEIVFDDEESGTTVTRPRG